MRRSLPPLRTRTGFLLGVAALAVFAAAGLGLRDHAQFEASIVAQTHGQLLTTAKSVSLSIREVVSLLSESLKVVADSEAVQQSLLSRGNRAFPARDIDALWEAYRDHATALYVLDSAGQVVHSSPVSPPYGTSRPSLADRPDVFLVLRSHAPFTSRPFLSSSGELVISVSRPIFFQSEFVGVARWLISVRSLADQFVTPVRVGRSGHIHLIDGDGGILAAADGAEVGRPALEKPRRLHPERDWSGLERLLSLMRAGGEGTGSIELICWRNDAKDDPVTPRLYAYSPVRFGDNFWSVIVTLDRDEVWGPIRRHALSQIVLLGLLLAVVGLIAQRWLALQRSSARAAAEHKFRALFDTMSEGVALHALVSDEAGAPTDYRILEINPAYERHTGLAAASARGALASTLYGSCPPPYLEPFAAVAGGGPAYVFETYFAPLRRHFRISVVSPQAGQFATVFEDITDRKLREEELRQKNAELERFIYTISHDLKSPLVTIKTFLGYLEQDLARKNAARTTQDLAYMAAAASRMGTLLDELLELSRVGRSVNPPARVGFNAIVDEARGMAAGTISRRGVAIWAYEADLILCGDRRRLVEIWQNLIDNAVKYLGDQPAPRIEIGVRARDGEQVFFVRDNGIGIEPRYHDKVFGLFEKLDPKSEGTGLGLALVRRIVELHRGTIWVESDGPGTGSCFFFTLPDALAPRDERTEP
jgi:signal transduction histidine kinase